MKSDHEDEQQALELATTTAAATTNTTTIIKLATEAATNLASSRAPQTSKQLVTFRANNSSQVGKGKANKRRAIGTAASEAPKCSLESINSRCSLSSANDDTSHHQLGASSRTHSDDSQIIIAEMAGLQPPAGKTTSYLMMEPSDDLGWRLTDWSSSSAAGAAVDREGRRGGSDRRQQHQPVAMMHTQHHQHHHQDTIDQLDSFKSLPHLVSLKSVEDVGGGGFGQGKGGGPGAMGKEVVEQGRVQAPFMFAGILASILGSIFFSLSFLCVKLLPDYSFLANARTLAFRGFFISACSGLTILYQRATFVVRRDEIWVIFLRSAFGTLGVYGAYCSMKYISLGDSTALVFSSPIWTSILGRIILKEPFQCAQLVALPASLFGIVLIAHPALIVDVDHLAIAPAQHLINANTSEPLIVSELTEYQHRWPGIVIALCTSLMVSGTYIVLKFRKQTGIQTTTFWLGSVMASASLLVLACAGGDTPLLPADTYEWCLLLVNGTFSWLGQCTLQWAFTYESASILSVVRTLDVALTFALSALFLDEQIYWTSIVGATIIGLVVASIMLNNYLDGCSTCAAACSTSVHAEDLRACHEPQVGNNNNNNNYSNGNGKQEVLGKSFAQLPYTISSVAPKLEPPDVARSLA